MKGPAPPSVAAPGLDPCQAPRGRGCSMTRSTEDEVFAAVYRVVYRVALRRVGDPEAAADLTQDVMVVLLDRYRGLGEEDLIPLGVRTLDFKLAAVWRRAVRRRPYQGPLPDLEPFSPDPDPEAAALERERHELEREVLAAAAGRIPELYRKVVLEFLEGKPVREIVKSSGAPKGTVWSWLSRGRQALARELRQMGSLKAVG